MEKKISKENMTDTESDKYLTFMVNEQYYGIHIASVIEIIGIQEITSVPEFPFYAKGIINLRGLIVPLIDINLRFGYGEKPYTDKTCIVVVSVDEVNVGFIVDEVDEVADIPLSLINPPPQLSEANADKFVSGIATLKDKIVLLMSSDKVINDADLQVISDQIAQ